MRRPLCAESSRIVKCSGKRFNLSARVLVHLVQGCVSSPSPYFYLSSNTSRTLAQRTAISASESISQPGAIPIYSRSTHPVLAQEDAQCHRKEDSPVLGLSFQRPKGFQLLASRRLCRRVPKRRSDVVGSAGSMPAIRQLRAKSGGCGRNNASHDPPVDFTCRRSRNVTKASSERKWMSAPRCPIGHCSQHRTGTTTSPSMEDRQSDQAELEMIVWQSPK